VRMLKVGGNIGWGRVWPLGLTCCPTALHDAPAVVAAAFNSINHLQSSHPTSAATRRPFSNRRSSATDWKAVGPTSGRARGVLKTGDVWARMLGGNFGDGLSS